MQKDEEQTCLLSPIFRFPSIFSKNYFENIHRLNVLGRRSVSRGGRMRRLRPVFLDYQP